jgi:Protein of unknown function (DUF4245)
MAKSQLRLRQTARDMVLSLGVIAVPIALILIIQPTTPPASPVSAISAADFQTTLAAARANEPFKLLVPAALPAGWQITSENYTEPGTTAADWHIGYLIPANAYAEVEQTTEPIGGFLSAQQADATDVANVQVDGVTWQEYSGTTPAALRTVLVRTATGSVTDLVAGSASLAQLEQLAGSLH